MQIGYFAVKSYYRCCTILFTGAPYGQHCIPRAQRGNFKGKWLQKHNQPKSTEVRMLHVAAAGFGADSAQSSRRVPRKRRRVHSHPAPLSDTFSWQQSKHISPIRLLSESDYLDIKILHPFLAINPDHMPHCHPACRPGTPRSLLERQQVLLAVPSSPSLTPF